ncbi:MAG: hypothetical protein ABIP37_02705 [Methylotenera sp.]
MLNNIVRPLMMKQGSTYAAWLFLILSIAPSLPTFRFLLASSMTFHMLVQIPALIIAGYLINKQLFPLITKPVSLMESLAFWLWILLTSMFWMLPISLDKALINPYWDVFKVTTLLLSGMFLRPAFTGPKILTLFFIGSTIMMLFFIGYFYQSSDLRLCNSYLIESQQTTGLGLIILAFGLLFAGIFFLRKEILDPA